LIEAGGTGHSIEMAFWGGRSPIGNSSLTPRMTAKMKVDDLDYASIKWPLKKLFIIPSTAHKIG